jgi:hypothetical protein
VRSTIFLFITLYTSIQNFWRFSPLPSAAVCFHLASAAPSLREKLRRGADELLCGELHRRAYVGQAPALSHPQPRRTQIPLELRRPRPKLRKFGRQSSRLWASPSYPHSSPVSGFTNPAPSQDGAHGPGSGQCGSSARRLWQDNGGGFSPTPSPAAG